MSLLSMSQPADWRAAGPLAGCPCGCDLLLIACSFDYETRLPGMYLTTGTCTSCGALLTVPTPVDEGFEVDDL